MSNHGINVNCFNNHIAENVSNYQILLHCLGIYYELNIIWLINSKMRLSLFPADLIILTGIQFRVMSNYHLLCELNKYADVSLNGIRISIYTFVWPCKTYRKIPLEFPTRYFQLEFPKTSAIAWLDSCFDKYIIHLCGQRTYVIM